MRDFLLSEAIKRLAADAAVRYSALVAGGEQIPFDVLEEDGPDSAFYLYEPLTSRFVREREDELRSLPSFVPARDAVDAAGVAASYLEACGEPVPADPRERASKLLTVFISSLWDGCTEFSLDRERLDRALAVLDAEARDADDAEVVIAPLVGLRMAQASLQLPHGVRVIRADAVEAPIEAMRSEGMGRAAWEPQFLAVAEQGEGPESAESAMRQLGELISVMRLFKSGGIGLGPYAFAPTGEGRWSRIPTGAPAARLGGYRLSEDEGAQLAELATLLEALPDPDGALSWAVARFEMGCARENALEGLSDHLLALRAVLDGHGPVGASLPMRASALMSADESCDRIEARGRIERALELERALMNGTPVKGGLELAVWIEEGARRMLREAALGELSDDLGTAADETLIATGLGAGDGSIVGTTSDWETPDTGEVEITVARRHEEHESRIRPQEDEPGIRIRALERDPDIEVPKFEMHVPEFDPGARADDQDTRIMEPVPAEDEIRITATNWLDEVSVERGTMEWTAAEGDGVGHRERLDSPRVRHLFQVPEDADWEVRELDYDHYNRRTAG